MLKCKHNLFLRVRDSPNRIKWWCLAIKLTPDSRIQPCSKKISSSNNNSMQQNLSLTTLEKVATILMWRVSHLHKQLLVEMSSMIIIQVFSPGLRIQVWLFLKSKLRWIRIYSWTWLTAPLSIFHWFKIRLVWMFVGRAHCPSKKLSSNVKIRKRWNRWNKTYSIPNTSQLRQCTHARPIS